jgi:hypothetical protein
MTLSIMIASLLFDFVESNLRELKSGLLAGCLMGLLPMVSAHAYIGVGEYAIFLCLLHFPFRQANLWFLHIKAWAVFGGAAVLVSAPQIRWLMRVHRADFMTRKPIYTETEGDRLVGAITVWWYSLAGFAVISLILAFFVNTPRQNRMYLPAIGVWFVSNFIRYQPGAMDNTKVFYAGWYTLACAATANYATIICKRRNVLAIVCLWLLLGTSFLGSCVAIWKAFWPYPLWSTFERDIGIWIMENTRRDSAVLVGGWHSNSLMSIAGRLATMGYGGWVWTHGLPIDKRIELMKYLIANRENATVFEPYKIEYAIKKLDESREMCDFTPPGVGSRWMLVHELDHLKIYRILKS